MNSFLLVGAGGAIGAIARYGLALLVGRFWSGDFPLATLLANVIGSFAMGVFVGLMAKLIPAAQNELRLLVAVGLLGGFTTFSAFSLDTIVLLQRGQLLSAIAYVALSVVVCLVGLYLGLLITRGSPA
ncbi:CrcB protein [Devosia crocina]|uniref:Fluoride-specific ion channel FluC n=1 Tax=Devosia crocina TaxID=429728 RepID=A0A1I7NDZ2_9HYPH|nr:fluoride efflux transporter CrcB [Devosia crocina]SFV32869.1 CrcB protein [Devosia crocina]